MKKIQQRTFEYFWAKKEDPLVIVLLVAAGVIMFSLTANDTMSVTVFLWVAFVSFVFYLFKLLQTLYLSRKLEYQKKYLKQKIRTCEEDIHYYEKKLEESLQSKEKYTNELTEMGLD